MASFIAEFPGRCAECGNQVTGHECAYDADHQVVHVDCEAAGPATPQLVGAPCPRCFITMPLTGGCDSCD